MGCTVMFGSWLGFDFRFRSSISLEPRMNFLSWCTTTQRWHCMWSEFNGKFVRIWEILCIVCLWYIPSFVLVFGDNSHLYIFCNEVGMQDLDRIRSLACIRLILSHPLNECNGKQTSTRYICGCERQEIRPYWVSKRNAFLTLKNAHGTILERSILLAAW